MLPLISAIILIRFYIYIKDLKVLKISIILPFILKNKDLMKLLLSLEEEKVVKTNLKFKYIDEIQILKSKKIPLLDNLNLTYILDISKKSWFCFSYKY